MPELIYDLTVSDQLIYAAGNIAVVADSRNTLRAHFMFRGETWDGINKTAVFVGPDKTPYNVLLENDMCLVPWEVIKTPEFSVSLFGGDLMTANKANISVQPSGYIEGVAPPTPTPDVYDQLVQTVQAERELAEAAADAAGLDANATAADRQAVAADKAAVSADKLAVADDKVQAAAARAVAVEAATLAVETADNIVTDEAARQAAETQRQTDEAERKQAEQLRQAGYDEFDGRITAVETDKASTASLSETNLRIATINKSLSDYQNTISSINVNQSPKQTASGYGTVSLPANASNGQISCAVGGVTMSAPDINGSFESDATGWSMLGTGMTIDASKYLYGTKSLKFSKISGAPQDYACLRDISFPENHKIYVRAFFNTDDVSVVTRLRAYDYGSYANPVATDGISVANQWVYKDLIKTSANGGIKVYAGRFGGGTFTLNIDGILAIDLTAHGLDTLTTNEVNAIVPDWFNGTNSTISAMRLRSVGANIWGSRKMADDVVKKINSPARAYISNIEGRNCLALGDTAGSIVAFDKFEPSTQYTISAFIKYSSTSPGGVFVIEYTDGTYGYPIQPSSTIFTYKAFTSAVGKSIKNIFLARHTAAEISYYDYDTFIINKGTVAAPYAPFAETTQYYPDCGILQSVGTANDEVNAVLGKQTKNINSVVLESIHITNLYTTDSNVDFVRTSSLAYPNNGFVQNEINKVYIAGWKGVLQNERNNLTSIGGYNVIGVVGNTYIDFIVANGTYASLAEAKLALAGTVLTYQLATPIVTPVGVTGTLVGHPNGAIYWEPVLPVAGVYTEDGIAVTNANYPIESIEAISILDFETGVETPIDVSKALISADGLSFTHPGLTAEDIVFFKYFHAVKGTLPKITATYYDGRYTKKDTANGKTYKWDVVFTNGVASIVGTEV